MFFLLINKCSLTWLSESPLLLCIQMNSSCPGRIWREESMTHCSARSIEGIAITMVTLEKVYLQVSCLWAAHLDARQISRVQHPTKVSMATTNFSTSLAFYSIEIFWPPASIICTTFFHWNLLIQALIIQLEVRPYLFHKIQEVNLLFYFILDRHH